MPSISEEQLNELVQRAADLAAEKAAERVKADFYKSVGKSIVDKLLWIAGIVILAGYLWATKNGLIK